MIIKRLLLITALLSILVRAEAASEAASKYFFKSAKSVLYVSPPSATASSDASDQIAGIFVSSDWPTGESDDKANDKVNASKDKKPDSSEDVGQMIPDEPGENGENNGDDGVDDGNDEEQGIESHDVSSNDLSKIPHNALIISRFGSDHALHTEISVGNIAEADVDAFPAKEGEKADTIFISLENENGTVEMFRIGLDEEIDEVVFLKGAVSADLLSDDEADDAKPPGGHFLPYFIGLDQIKSPVIVIMPDTGEQIYFPDGKTLSEQPFKEEYKIEEIRAVRNEIEIRLSKKDK